MSLILAFFLYIFVGAAAGILAGLLGISGGLVTVPSLLLIFTFMGFPKAYIMHLAIGTSLASMVFNSLSAAWSHHQKKAVLWKIVKQMSFGIILGSILGALLAHVLSEAILEILFGLFAITLGVRFWRHAKVIRNGNMALPSPAVLNAIGAGIGGLSNILGIGGGVITVPILMNYRIPAKNAIATSAATGFFITLIGAIAYLIFGLQQEFLPQTIGYINIPAFLTIALVSFFAAPYGVILAHRLEVSSLRRIFGAVLILTGLVMIFRPLA